MVQIGRNHYTRGRALTAEALARRVMMPTHVVEDVLDTLVQRGFLVHTGHEPAAYVPASALDVIRVVELLEGVRSAEEDGHVSVARLPSEPAVDDLFHRLGSAVETTLAETSLKDLVLVDLPAKPATSSDGNADIAD
jgi:DNA-binding IscR family transcriptional regulator